SAPLTVYSGWPSSSTQVVSVSPNPSLFGQLPQALVRVTAGSGIAAGRITLRQSGVILAKGDLDASASVRLSLPSLPVGSWPVTAEYAGSPKVQASVSAPFTLVVNPALVFLSAASGQKTIAPDSLATVYGTNLSPVSITAPSLPLPTDLGGAQLSIPGATGEMLKAPLLFVSPGQVNFLVPAQAKLGSVIASLSSAGQTFSGESVIDSVAPAVFTADGSGSGAPIGVLVTSHSDGSQETHAAYECGSMGCQTVALDVAGSTDTNVLVLYATGIRNARLQDVTVQVDSVNASVLFSGPQGEFSGLDQMNVQLPSSLAGRGDVALQVNAGGKQANAVRVRFR
ncbi:MAG: hypothetical protein JWO80_5710, partial [Bryobacterales bacterium]|nr:hypothetical protein [Bryobacterales bacterium]